MVTFDRLREFQDGLSKAGIAGNDLAIFVGNEEVYRYMTGYRDLENKLPIDQDTLYRMYSMTKPITVVAAMQLHEQGRFFLDQPLSRYLPEFKNMYVQPRAWDGKKAAVPARNPILIRHLFEMTAGLTYNYASPGFEEMYARTNYKHTLKDVSEALAKDPLLYEPGTHWFYSLAHDVLARLVEVISGMSFGEYLRKNVFDPCGMEKACHHPSEEEMAHCAKIYTLGPDMELVPAPAENPFWTGPNLEGGGAGLICTVDEYAKFTKMLTHLGLAETGARVLSERSVEIIRTNRLTPALLEDFWSFNKTRNGYGYGLGVRTMMDPSVNGSMSSVGEFGWGGALGTYMIADPAADVTLVYAQQATKDERRPEYQRPIRNIAYSALSYAGLIK